MKKNVLWVLMLAVGLVSCNNENEAPEVGGAKGECALLKVNIKEAGSISRAGTVGDYKAGSADENKVTKVDFYFFNANGSAYSVDGATNGENYITVTSAEFTDKTAGSNVNVESVSNIILVIKGAEKQLPTQMVAIINDPNAAAKKSLATLESEIEAKELALMIEEFLETLTAENRVIFIRRYWFSDTYKEIADRVGITEKMVSMRLTRIRKQMREYLVKREVLA